MPLLQPVASTASNAEASQEIPTTNALINQLNTSMGPLMGATFPANGSVATVLGSLGPVGSHTAVQKWLQITDSTGTPLFIPCF